MGGQQKMHFVSCTLVGRTEWGTATLAECSWAQNQALASMTGACSHCVASPFEDAALPAQSVKRTNDAQPAQDTALKWKKKEMMNLLTT